MTPNNRLRGLLVGALVVAAVALTAYFATRTHDTNGDLGLDAQPVPPPVPLPNNAREPVWPESADVVHAGRAWVVVDPESVDELPAYKEVVPGRALVRVSEDLRLGATGDRIELTVPQIGRAFEGVVEQVETDSFGNVTYIGFLTEANGQDYRFVITAGTSNTFATIATSLGTYELVASHDLGWLMPATQMDQHVDYSQPDYFIPEERPVHEQE